MLTRVPPGHSPRSHLDATAATLPPGELAGLNTLMRGANGTVTPKPSQLGKTTNPPRTADQDQAPLGKTDAAERRFRRTLGWSLVGADVALFGLAGFILQASPAPLSWLPIIISALAVGSGAWLSCLALVSWLKMNPRIMNEKSKANLSFLFGRRSIRVFAEGDVPDDALQTLLEAAMAAPSAVAKDPWRFVVVREKEMLRKITEALPNGAMLPSASLGIVVCGDLDAAHDRQLSYLLQDCSAAIENLLLGAHILGLGACWLGVHPRANRMEHIRRLLELPAAIIPVACIAVGYPGEIKEPRTRFDRTRVHYGKWGG